VYQSKEQAQEALKATIAPSQRAKHHVSPVVTEEIINRVVEIMLNTRNLYDLPETARQVVEEVLDTLELVLSIKSE